MAKEKKEPVIQLSLGPVIGIIVVITLVIAFFVGAHNNGFNADEPDRCSSPSGYSSAQGC